MESVMKFFLIYFYTFYVMQNDSFSVVPCINDHDQKNETQFNMQMPSVLDSLYQNGSMVTKDITLNYKFYDSGASEKRPFIIFLHGAGERGNDNYRQLTWGVSDILTQSKALGEDPIVFIPQCPEGFRWVEVHWGDESHIQPETPSKPLEAVMKIVDSLLTVLPIDLNRIYLTGISMGGFGTWDYVIREPELFAAVIPVCGGADVEKLSQIATIPTWIFHGDSDTVVLTKRSRDAYKKLKQLGAPVLYTEFEQTGHNAWIPAYQLPELYQWLFKQRKQN